MSKPKYLEKNGTVYQLNEHGSYNDLSDKDSYAFVKNAMSYTELLKLGYKPFKS